jgi:hypothetical protein
MCVEIMVSHHCSLTILSQNFSHDGRRDHRGLTSGFLGVAPGDLVVELGLELGSAVSQLVCDCFRHKRLIIRIPNFLQFRFLFAQHVKHLVNLLRVHIAR